MNKFINWLRDLWWGELTVKLTEPDWEDYQCCTDVVGVTYCASAKIHCFEYEDDYEDGDSLICKHCWVQGGKGVCELNLLEDE